MKIYFCFLCLICLSCKESNPFANEQVILNDLASTYKINHVNKRMVYIVTGLDGCGACLDYTVDFINKNSSNPNLVFVLSGKSKVKVRALFNQNTIRQNNFYRDTLLIALKKGLVSKQNPKAFFSDSNLIVDAKNITYKNADSLFNYINNFTQRK